MEIRDKLGRFVKGSTSETSFKKGHKMSEETKLKMKGRLAWNKGLKVFCGKDNPFFGKHHSEETKEKIRMKNRGIKPNQNQLRGLEKGRGLFKGKSAPWAKNLPQKFNSGEKHPMWKGGSKAWRGTEWKKISNYLRSEIKKCELCGKEKNLSVHHIIPYTETKDNSLVNLIVLCKSCHAKEDIKMAKKIRNLKELNGYWERIYGESVKITLGNPLKYRKRQII